MQDYVGYRTKRRQAQKKKKKKLWKVLVGILVLFLVFILLGAVFEVPPIDRAWTRTYDGFVWLGRKIKSIWPSKVKPKPGDFLPEGKKTANYLIAGTKRFNGSIWLGTLALISYDSKTESASIIYFPSDLQVNVPGAGMDIVSNLIELGEGQISMALVAVENLLGVEIDRCIMGSDIDLNMILSKVAPEMELSIPKKVSFEDSSLKVRVNLDVGKQKLKSKTIASYVTYAKPGDEMDLISRQVEFTRSFLALCSKGSVYEKIPSIVREYSGIISSDASVKEIQGLWRALSLLGKGKLKQVTVPVEVFKYEKTIVHRVNQKELQSFVKKYVKSESSTDKRIRVEILNGCGVPGIGEKVAGEINLTKFRVVNTGNADNFDYPETVVIVYDNSKKDIVEAANVIRKELEVGKIEAHPQNQNLIDITVIIGKDYAGK